MAFNQIALLALAAFISVASADKEEFPLVWVCLGITVAGVLIALYVAYKRPEELQLPGHTVMTAHESSEDPASATAADSDEKKQGETYGVLV